MTAKATPLTGFAPVSDENARILVLGSMPGVESLRHGQYYAHPRNAFWPILGELAGALPSLPYPQRLERLKANGIALWDVLGACVRPGSLDTAIDPGSIVANDFAAFYRAHPFIQRVFFNGAYAETAYRRHVLKALPAAARPMSYQRLPSTSPAHAARDLGQKLDAWRAIIAP